MNLLLGRSFTIPNKDGTDVYCEFDDPWPSGWPKTGLEAYVVPIKCTPKNGNPYFSVLKNFKEEVHVREPRTTYLVNSGLAAKYPEMFQGVPYAWISKINVNGLPLYGHITKLVGAEFGGVADDLKIMRAANRTQNDEVVRVNLALQLAEAIEILESEGICHGDISPGNVMIGSGPIAGEPLCSLIDFDGFSHASQSHLPRKVNGLPFRPLGSEGYQSPEILRQMASDPDGNDDSVFVSSDRFGLAVMCTELAIWDGELGEELENAATPRESLLDASIILGGNLDVLGNKILDRNPQAFKLLQEALSASSYGSMPSASDWISALGRTVKFENTPRVEIFRVRGNDSIPVRKANLTNLRGDFSAVDQRLKPVNYTLNDGEVTLGFGWNQPAMRRLTGSKMRQYDGNQVTSIQVRPGESIVSNGWRFDFSDVVT